MASPYYEGMKLLSRYIVEKEKGIEWTTGVPTECGTYWAWHSDAEAPNPIRIVDIRREEDQERPGEIVREVFFGNGAGGWEYDCELAEHERRDDVMWYRFNMPASPWGGDE